MRQPKNIRWYVYWALDFLKGSPVGRYYRQIKQDYEHGTSADETRAKVQALIKHAVKTTNFYQDFSPDVDLGDLPIVNKSFYKERYDDFISSEYRKAKTNRVMHTSGSTGTPFAMIQNKQKALHNTAASIFLLSLANFYIGTKQALIGVWIKENRKTRIRAFMENVLMVDSTILDDKSIGGMIQTLASKQVKSILINASSLTLIYKYLEKNPTEAAIVKLESIVSTAEILPEDIRKPLGKILDCQVRSMYANQENGIMAIQDGDGKEYYFDTSTYVIEVLKLDSDEPAAKGEIGRLVITDLYNYAFPLIRYENGDMGIILKKVEGDKYRVYLEEISGRITDLIYDSYGRLLSPSAVNIRMWVSKGIKQFQFIQVDEKKYQLKINPESDKVDENAIFESIMPLLGEDAELEIIYVEEIPVLNSGKRKQTVNLYRKPS